LANQRVSDSQNAPLAEKEFNQHGGDSEDNQTRKSFLNDLNLIDEHGSNMVNPMRNHLNEHSGEFHDNQRSQEGYSLGDENEDRAIQHHKIGRKPQEYEPNDNGVDNDDEELEDEEEDDHNNEQGEDNDDYDNENNYDNEHDFEDEVEQHGAIQRGPEDQADLDSGREGYNQYERDLAADSAAKFNASEPKSLKTHNIPPLKIPRKPGDLTEEEILQQRRGEDRIQNQTNKSSSGAHPLEGSSNSKQYHHHRSLSETEYELQKQVGAFEDGAGREPDQNDDYEDEEEIEEGEDQEVEAPKEDGEEEDGMDSDTLRRNMEFFGSIATIIQKVWRGYRTRKILREYFEFILNNEMYGEYEGEEGEEEEEEETMDDEYEREELQRHFLIQQR
jgi:hypothetical protein